MYMFMYAKYNYRKNQKLFVHRKMQLVRRKKIYTFTNFIHLLYGIYMNQEIWRMRVVTELKIQQRQNLFFLFEFLVNGTRAEANFLIHIYCNKTYYSCVQSFERSVFSFIGNAYKRKHIPIYLDIGMFL